MLSGDRLLVPGGRSIPACYDRHTGRRLHYRLADGSKLGGGPDVVAAHDLYVNGGGAFDLATGSFLGLVAEPVAAAGTMLFSATGTHCRAFDLAARPGERRTNQEETKGPAERYALAEPHLCLDRANNDKIPPKITQFWGAVAG